MKWFNYFTLFVAAGISVCAAYYSIVGLTAIFSAAFWSIVIMGSSLEIAKITSAVWLHLNWHRAKWWIKLYMTPSVLVLMIITSIGIFGFLSRAHIEQAATTQEAESQIERIESEIARFELSRERAVQQIQRLETGNTGADAAIQTQIDREQQRVDAAYERVQPAIIEQQNRIASLESTVDIASLQNELDELDQREQQLNTAISSGNIEQAQSLLIQWGFLVGQADGVMGRQTSSAIQNFQTDLAQRQTQIDNRITQARSSVQPDISAAQAEIDRIRSQVETQVQQSLDLIAQLSAQLGQRSGSDLQQAITEQNNTIKEADQEVEQLITKKFELERQVRKLEAEVGPIKYVAELAFGEADRNLLERAVQWLILLLVAVFDPLAVIMILAATGGIVGHKNMIETWTHRIEEPEENNSNTKDDTDRKKKDEPKFSFLTWLENQPNPEPTVVEKIVEVPVEVPVEKIVEKQVLVEDTERIDELAEEVLRLLNTIETQKSEIKQLKDSQQLQIPETTLTAAKARSRTDVTAKADNVPDLERGGSSTFGTSWPTYPAKGDLFLKVDSIPNKLYKWTGRTWIEIDRGHVDNTLVFNTEYIDWLIKQIRRGHTDLDQLSDMERTQIRTRIIELDE